MRPIGPTVLALAIAAQPGLALAAPGKAAASDPYTAGYQRCLDAPQGQTTVGMMDCADAELKIQDARLNAAYRKAISGLNPRQKAKLVAAQRAWVAFRDADCTSLEDEDWGSLSRINAAVCVLTRTVDRTNDLKDYPPDQ